MKRILYFAVIIMTSLAFTACGDDDDANGSANPQVDVAGTYSGEWTIEVVQTNEFGDGSPTTETVIFSGTDNGSVVMTAASQYSADMNFVSTKVAEYLGENLTSRVNVTLTSAGYFLYNPISSASTVDGIKTKVESYGGVVSETYELVIDKYTRSEEETKEVQTGVDRRGRPIMKASTVTTKCTVSFTGTKQ